MTPIGHTSAFCVYTVWTPLHESPSCSGAANPGVPVAADLNINNDAKSVSAIKFEAANNDAGNVPQANAM